MHEPEQEGDDEAVPQARFAEDILDRHPQDRGGDKRLDDCARRAHSAGHRQRQGEAVGKREGGHDAEHPPQARGADQKGKQEEEVIVASEDVLDAKPNETPETAGRACAEIDGSPSRLLA
jgi:hypothetical protein